MAIAVSTGEAKPASGVELSQQLFQVFPAIHPDVHRGDFADLDLLQCTSDCAINHLDFIRG